MPEAPRICLTRKLLYRVQGALDFASGHEIALALYGGRKGRLLVLTHALIFPQTSGFAHFNVEARDAEAIGASAEQDLPHAIPLGYAHTHPGYARPVPSGIDLDNRDAIAPLMMPFTYEARTFEASVPGVREPGRWLWKTSTGLTLSIESQDPGGEPPTLDIRATSRNGYQVFLIFNKRAEHDRVFAEAVEHVLDPSFEPGPPIRVHHDDLPVEIVSTDRAADLLGWTAAESCCCDDYEILGSEVKAKLRIVQRADEKPEGPHERLL